MKQRKRLFRAFVLLTLMGLMPGQGWGQILNESFDSYRPAGWTAAQGALGNPSTLYGTNSYWEGGSFLNAGTTESALLRIWATSSTPAWMISPSVNLGDGSTPYVLKFDLGLTTYDGTAAGTMDADDLFAVLISTDDGASWTTTNILRQWDSNTPISNLGQAEMISLAGYTGMVKFGFVGKSTASTPNSRTDLFVDNVVVETPTEPFFNANPASLVFELTPLGNSRTMTTTITNIGGGSMTISDASALSIMGANASFFSISQVGSVGQTYPITLGFGQSVSCQVTYAPTSEGSHSANLGINTAELGDQSVALTGSCATITAIPHAQNFDGVTAPAFPLGWEPMVTTTSPTSGGVWMINSSTPWPANFVEFRSGADASASLMLVSPPIAEDLNLLKVKFMMYASTYSFEVGVYTPDKAFQVIQTLSNGYSFEEQEVSLASYSGTGNRVAIRFVPAAPGGTVDTYRSGYIDDFSLEYLPGDLAGIITDAATGAPIEGAQVSIAGMTAYSQADGSYSIAVPAGEWEWTASAAGYYPTSGSATIMTGSTQTLDVSLEAATPGVYLIGDATSAGWGSASALPLEWVEGSLFRGTFELAGPNTLLRFLKLPGLATPSWGYASGTQMEGMLDFRDQMPEPAYILGPGISGTYEISVDTANLSYTIIRQCLPEQELVVMDLFTDYWGYQTSWTLANGSETIYTGDNFQSTTHYNTQFCLSYDCYGLTVSDWGDGIYAPYGYGLRNLDQDLVYRESSQNGFTSSELTEFCIFDPATLGDLTGVVTDAATGAPIEGAEVSISGKSALSQADGSYSITGLLEGEWEWTASASGYYPTSGSATIVAGSTQTLDISLEAAIPGVYLIGDATSAGWGSASALPLEWVEGSLFQGTFELAGPGTQLRFIKYLGMDAPTWGYAAGTPMEGTLDFRGQMPAPANILGPGISGTYEISVDTTNLSYTIIRQCLPEQELVVLDLFTDPFGNETSWTLANGSEAIYTGSDLAGRAHYNTQFCLSYDCYGLTVNDSYGDGIYVPYGYSLRNLDRDLTYRESYQNGFSSSEETSFCLFDPATPLGNVEGIVTQASTGDPVEGATVNINGQSAISQADGSYSISGLPAGELPWMAEASGFGTASGIATIVAGTTQALDISLQTNRLTVHVFDGLGNLVNGATVRLFINVPGSGWMEYYTETVSDGTLVLEGLSTQYWYVSSTYTDTEGHTYEARSPIFYIVPSEDKEVILVLQRRYQVNITVLDENMAPLTANVHLRSNGAIYTAENGLLTLNSQQGPLSYSVYADGYETQGVMLEVANEDIDRTHVMIPSDYCTVEGTSSAGAINKVSLSNGFERSSTWEGYNFHEPIAAIFAPGSSLDMEAMTKGGWQDLRVWVDWNNDGYFAESETQGMGSEQYSDGNKRYWTTLAPSADAAWGQVVRARVWLGVSWEMPTNGCGWANYEVEDYQFLLVEPTTLGELAGVVTDAGTGSPIEGARVSILRSSTLTAPDGSYSFSSLPEGEWEWTASADGYQSASGSATIVAGSTQTLDISLQALPTANATFLVTDGGGNPIEGAVLTLGSDNYTTDAQGQITVILFGNSQYAYSVWADGFLENQGTLSMGEQDQDITIVMASYQSILFNCDMSNLIAAGGFDPATDELVLSASFNQWGSISMSDTDGDGVYSTQRDGFLVGAQFLYTYKLVNGLSEFPTISMRNHTVVFAQPNLLDDEFGFATYAVSFMVKDADDNPLEGASVSLDGQTATTGADGSASFADFLPGSYDYAVTLAGYETESGTVTVVDGDVQQTVVMTPGQSTVSIQFNCDMTIQIDGGAFDPEADFLDMAGTLNNWGSGDAIVLADEDGDGTYTATVAGFIPGDAVSYKYRINGNWDTSEFPNGGPNRDYTVTGANPNVVNDVYNGGNLVSVASASGEWAFSMFPNPAWERVSFEGAEGATIELFNLLGQRVAALDATQGQNSLSVEGLPNGTYLVRLTRDGQQATARLVVVH